MQWNDSRLALGTFARSNKDVGTFAETKREALNLGP